MKKVLGVIIVLIIVIAAFGSCGEDATNTPATTGDTPSQSTEVQPAPAATGNFTVIEHSATVDEYGYTTIVGKVKNNTDKEWAYVQVEISLFDKDGNQMGSTLDNINNLGAGATWSFKAMGLEKDISKYEIKEVSGW